VEFDQLIALLMPPLSTVVLRLSHCVHFGQKL